MSRTADIAGPIRRIIKDLDLRLRGRTVVTECATGPYASTPAIAAAAGAARVVAFGADSPHGSYARARREVAGLLDRLGLGGGKVVFTRDERVLLESLGAADVLTNSGHLRPIDAKKLRRLRRGACVPVMYELWELRRSDIDLGMCRRRGIRVVGTNERHPRLGIFDRLGPMVARTMADRGVRVRGSRVLLVCDNEFRGYIARGLRKLGAEVASYPARKGAAYDTVVFAQTPPASGGSLKVDYGRLPPHAPLCLQVWGDVDRRRVRAEWVPAGEPEKGHMGLNITEAGHETVVRLMAGSLKAAELALEGKTRYAGVRLAQY